MQPKLTLKTLWRNAFGKTKKSPLLWGQDSNYSHRTQIERWHNQFWSVNQTDELNTDALVLSNDPLLKLAHFAYLDANSTPTEKEEELSCLSNAPFEFQIRFIELPIWKFCLGVEAVDFKKILQTWKNFVEDILDRDGWPEANIVEDVIKYMASWCRVQILVDLLAGDIDDELHRLLCSCFVQLQRLKRADGSVMFSKGQLIDSSAFERRQNELWADPFFRQLRSSPSNRREVRQPAASSISEWAQIGANRRDWKKNSERMGFKFNNRRIQLEIGNRYRWIEGDCTPELSTGDVELKIRSEIGVSGFMKFDDGEFLELEMEFEGFKVYRQLLLLTDDRLLFFADHVVADDNVTDTTCYRCCLPTHPDVQFVNEHRNAEVYMKNNDVYSLVIPLFLPEWRTEQADGRLVIHEDYFEIKKKNKRASGSVALVFDLDRKRSLKPRTWRRLTVAEKMSIVEEDTAVAYRLQIGKQQWIFYRSLGPKASRTFLGQNYADDFYVGRMKLDGTVEAILEIE